MLGQLRVVPADRHHRSVVDGMTSRGGRGMAELTPMSGMSHVAFCVRNLDRALRFYRDLLGFQVVKDALQDTRTGGLPHLYRQQHAQRRVVHLQAGAGAHMPILVLTEHPGDTLEGEPIMLDQVGISHLSFTVPDVEALSKRLLAQGAETCGPVDAFKDAQGRIRTVFFRDPDGILVQFDEGLE
jgi:catechol 2,3-dioxygenase-like lactoylglutathione lyase family enzyme